MKRCQTLLEESSPGSMALRTRGVNAPNSLRCKELPLPTRIHTHGLTSFLSLLILIALPGLCITACDNPTGTHPDTTPPGIVTELDAAPGNTHIVLTWIDPADEDFDHVEITLSPTAGITQPISVPMGSETCDVKGLANGTSYTFTLVAVDRSGNKSGPVTTTAAPDASGADPAPDPLASIAAMTAYLASADGGTDADNPVLLPVAINLMNDGMALFSALQTANKYVALDLSACAMDGITDTPGEFGLPPDADNVKESRIVSLVLPRAATSIARNAGFGNFNALKRVSADRVTSIGFSAFSDCAALTEVSFPAATFIGNLAFSGCAALTTASLPRTVTIDTGAFLGCAALTEASFPMATSIGDSAFDNCAALAEVNLPAATIIGDSAFGGCVALTEVSLPAATSIGSAFYYCASLTAVSLPVATTIGESAFGGCVALTEANFPMATSIGGGAFFDCAALTAVSLPAATSIGNHAFFNCAALTEAYLPAATTIGDYAFDNCVALTGLNLPAVASIGESAFDNCAALTELNLPAAATIGNFAFSGCVALTELNLPAATTIGERAFGQIGETALTITLPKAAPTVTGIIHNPDGYSKTVTINTPDNRTGYDTEWETAFKALFNTGGAITLIFVTDENSNSEDNTTPPAAVTNLTAVVDYGRVDLTWTDPADKDFHHVEITFSPEAASVTQPITVPKGVQNRPIENLGETAYTFTIVAVDMAGNRSNPASVTPPANVTDLSAASNDGQVYLTWTDPANVDFHHVEITFSPEAAGITQPITVLKGAQNHSITGLVNGTIYNLVIISVGTTGSRSGPSTIMTTPSIPDPDPDPDKPDLTLPANITDLSAATSGHGRVVLTWTDPADSAFDHIEITFTPETTGVTQPITVLKGTQTRTVTGLVNGTPYTFTVVSVYTGGNRSNPMPITMTPVEALDVTNLHAEAGNGGATLTWTDPVSATLSYVEITFSPEAAGIQPRTVSKGTQSCFITDLANGTTYTFTVKTVNTAGGRSAGTTTTTTPVDPVSAIAEQLAAAAGGANPDNPVPLALNLDLTDNWYNLLSAIKTAGKYVSLDLTACAMTSMTNTEGGFYLGSLNAGENLITSLTLPAGATSIEGTYYESPPFASLKTIRGNAVTSIGEWIFFGCTTLTEVSFPVATTIGGSAFSNCAALTEVSIPKATTIGGRAFADCAALTGINFPEATSIGEGAFSGTALTEANFFKAITIGESAFGGTALTEVSLPDATTIGGGAFSNCAALTTAILPKVTSIGFGAFDDCTALTTVSLPKAVAIEHYTFAGCTALTTASFPKAVTIGEEAFFGCAALTMVSLPEATSIDGRRAFAGCAALTELSLPKATIIGELAFADCVALTVASLPAVTSIGERAFEGCPALSEVSLSKAVTIGGGAFTGAALAEVSLPVATSIGEEAFSGTALTELSLPVATSIGNYAFSGCAALTAVSLPAATSIGNYAFRGCIALTEVSLPTATSIGGGAFSESVGSGGITTLTITLPKAAPTITSSIFVDGYQSTTVTIKTPAGKTGYDSAWETAFKTTFITGLITLNFVDL